VRRPGERPVLITNAARSQAEQLRSRERRYVAMMLIRAVCVIVFAVLVGTRPPLLWLWLVLTGVAAVVIPWLAVILANDGPPKDKHRLAHHRQKTEPPQQSLPAQAQPAPHKTIDAEP
jgi:sterol desaturase/sphingolipid hydroxylase (fatty acid hydroxylase superfamily)